MNARKSVLFERLAISEGFNLLSADECGVNLGQCLRSHIAARSPSDTFDPGKRNARSQRHRVYFSVKTAFELATRLEMGEFLRQKALCSGEECHQVLLQVRQIPALPHDQSCFARSEPSLAHSAGDCERCSAPEADLHGRRD